MKTFYLQRKMILSLKRQIQPMKTFLLQRTGKNHFYSSKRKKDFHRLTMTTFYLKRKKKMFTGKKTQKIS